MNIKLLLAIAVPVLTAGFLFTYFMTNYGHVEEPKTVEEQKEPSPSTASPSPPVEVEENEEAAEPVERSEEDETQSKKIAEEFAKAFYTYDANEPLKYAENSRSYASESFYKQMMEKPRRNTLDAVKTSVKHIDTFPVDGGDASKITWNVIIEGEAVNNEGEAHMQERWLWVFLEKKNDKWVVEGVQVDGRTDAHETQ